MHRNLLQIRTRLGWFGAYLSEAGVLAVTCPQPNAEEALAALLGLLPSGVPLSTGPPPARLAATLRRNLVAYALGKAVFWPLPLDPRATSLFQRRVFQTLWRVPFATVVSYGGLAEACGMPNAARAVGQAVGTNRWAIVVPCHRVIAADGGLGGFGGGLRMKRMLLEHEGLDLAALRPARLPTKGGERGPRWSAG